MLYLCIVFRRIPLFGKNAQSTALGASGVPANNVQRGAGSDCAFLPQSMLIVNFSTLNTQLLSTSFNFQLSTINYYLSTPPPSRTFSSPNTYSPTNAPKIHNIALDSVSTANDTLPKWYKNSPPPWRSLYG